LQSVPGKESVTLVKTNEVLFGYRN
jgi:hypothetical protein